MTRANQIGASLGAIIIGYVAWHQVFTMGSIMALFACVVGLAFGAVIGSSCGSAIVTAWNVSEAVIGLMLVQRRVASGSRK